jgi:hypothetical protein
MEFFPAFGRVVERISMAKGPAPLTVTIPPKDGDRPSWTRVGVLAIIGFAVGVAWPHLAGVRIGPSAPADAAGSVAAASRAPDAPSGVPALGSAPAALSMTAATPSASASAPPAALPPVVTVSRGQVNSCKNEAGDSLKGKECGGLAGLDPIVQARLKHVAQVPGAAGNLGKLSVTLNLDFTQNRVSYVDVGKASTVKDTEPFKTFLAGEMKSMSLKPVDHENPKYSVSYTVTLAEGVAATPGAGSGSGSGTPAGDADGTATVGWEVAIVRDAPHTGTVLARLPRGTKVQTGTMQAGWYKIKYGPGFATEGWVYRGAIGK